MKINLNKSRQLRLGKLLSIIFGLCLMLMNHFVQAAIDTFDFADDKTRERFQILTTELRCPKCQNQNLADSNAPIAMDLRKEVYRLLTEGQSDSDIKSYLVDRYGEYVLYKPEWSPQTWLLWVAPAVLLVSALVVVILIARRRSRTVRETVGGASLSVQEQQRINQLLHAQSQASGSQEIKPQEKDKES